MHSKFFLCLQPDTMLWNSAEEEQHELLLSFRHRQQAAGMYKRDHGIRSSRSKFHWVPHHRFKKFHGVGENPAEVLVGTIEEYVRKDCGMPTGTLLGSYIVLETTGEGALGLSWSFFIPLLFPTSTKCNQLTCKACLRTEMHWKLTSPKQKTLEPHRMTREWLSTHHFEHLIELLKCKILLLWLLLLVLVVQMMCEKRT